jgi:hypothetical protein
MQEEEGEQPALARSTDLQHCTAARDLERPQQPELEAPLILEGHRAKPAVSDS